MNGVDGGDPDRVTDRRVGGAPPALAQDSLAAAEVDDLVHDEEVAGEVEPQDQLEFASDGGVGLRMTGVLGWAIPLPGAPHGELHEPGVFGMSLRHRIGRQVGGDESEVESAFQSESGCGQDRLRVAVMALHHVSPAAQDGRMRGKPPVDGIQACSGADGCQGISQVPIAGGGGMDGPGGDDGEANASSNLHQGIVAARILRPRLISDLDGDVVFSEQAHQSFELAARR